MTTEEIVKAIEKATNGTFIPPCHSSTLMGGGPDEYDEEGRLVTVDSNYKHGVINICGTSYSVTRVGWDVFIWKPEYQNASYTWVWKENRDEYLLSHFNIMPDYVKVYKEKKEARLLQRKKDFVEKGNRICFLIGTETTSTYIFAYEGELAVVELGKSDKYGNTEHKWENVKNFQYFMEHQFIFLLRGLHNDLGIDVPKKYKNSLIW